MSFWDNLSMARGNRKSVKLSIKMSILKNNPYFFFVNFTKYTFHNLSKKSPKENKASPEKVRNLSCKQFIESINKCSLGNLNSPKGINKNSYSQSSIQYPRFKKVCIISFSSSYGAFSSFPF